MATIGNKIKQNLSTEYYCEKCDYITCRKSNINNHYKSTRHILATNGNIIKQSENNNFICEFCDKIYKDRTGLWKHKKICKEIKNTVIKEDVLIPQQEEINEDKLTILITNIVTKIVTKLVSNTVTDTVTNTITNLLSQNNEEIKNII